MAIFKDRHLYIGASDFPVIMGKSPWKSREKLALEKGQVIVPLETDNPALARGTRLEPLIIQRFMEETGIKVSNFQKEVTLPATETRMKILAHLDGETEDGLCFEAKTTLKNNKWSEPPEHYIPQLELQMFLNHCEKSYIAVGYVENDDAEDICGFDYFEWQRTMADDEILAECESFTTLVKDLKTRFGTISNGLYVYNSDIDNTVEELETIKEKISAINKQLKPLEDEKKKLENGLKNLISDNTGVESDLYRITLGCRVSVPSEINVSRSTLKIEYK